MVDQGIGGDAAFLESFRQMAVGVINHVDFLRFGSLCWHYSLWRWSDCLCLTHLWPLLLLLSLGAGFWNCATVIDRAVCSWAVARWHHTGMQVHFIVSPQGPGASTWGKKAMYGSIPGCNVEAGHGQNRDPTQTSLSIRPSISLASASHLPSRYTCETGGINRILLGACYPKSFPAQVPE